MRVLRSALLKMLKMKYNLRCLLGASFAEVDLPGQVVPLDTRWRDSTVDNTDTDELVPAGKRLFRLLCGNLEELAVVSKTDRHPIAIVDGVHCELQSVPCSK